MTPLENILEYMESPGYDIKQSHEMWGDIARSKNPRMKGLSHIWTAVCFLVVAERTKLLQEIHAESVITFVVRAAKHWDKRLLWHFAANDAIRHATVAKTQDPRFSKVADSIVDRANEVLKITEDDARTSGELRIVSVEEVNAGIDVLAGWMAIWHSDLSAISIVECARSLTGHEVMFENVDINVDIAKVTGRECARPLSNEVKFFAASAIGIMLFLVGGFVVYEWGGAAWHPGVAGGSFLLSSLFGLGACGIGVGLIAVVLSVQHVIEDANQRLWATAMSFWALVSFVGGLVVIGRTILLALGMRDPFVDHL